MTNRRDFLKGMCAFVAALWAAPKLFLDQMKHTRRGMTIYVAEDGCDLDDGLSSETAKRTLSAAIQALPLRGYAQSAVFMSGYFHDETTAIPADVDIYLMDDTIMERCVIMGKSDA